MGFDAIRVGPRSICQDNACISLKTFLRLDEISKGVRLVVKKIGLAVAALGLAAAPAMAQVAGLPASAPLTGDESNASGETIVIAVIAGAAVIGGIVAATSGNDRPVSR